jgi:hypothetical protein
VERVEAGGLAALVASVPRAEFGEEPLRRNLNDLQWLERVARSHEAVLERAMATNTIVPLRLCTLYETEGNVRQMLEREGKALRGALARLTGRQEWGVKVLVDPQKLAEEARARTGEDGTLDEELEGLGGGGAYMLRRRQERETREVASALARELAERIHARLEERARSSPIDPGIAIGELVPGKPWRASILPLLGIDQRGGKAYRPGAAASLAGREEAAERLEHELAAAGLIPVPVDDAELAAYLEAEGRLVRVGDGLAIGTEAYEQARTALVGECERTGRITLARFRDLLGISRRPAQLLLERFDADGLTRRVGDERVLRRAAVSRGRS